MNKFLTSSLGKKAVMSATGLFLIVFLVEHLYTNLHLYYGDGGEEFNEASHWMSTSLLIRTVEIVLFAAIILHVVQAIILTKQNNEARPVKYAIDGASQTSPWISRNMGLTGSLIFFFIVVHLYNYFLPYRITGEVGGEGQITLAEKTVEALHNPIYAGLYFVAVIILAWHISHGFHSAFQSLGINNKKYTPIMKIASKAMAVLFGLGYASFPVIFYVAHMMKVDLLHWNM